MDFSFCKVDFSESSFEFSPMTSLKFDDDEPMDVIDVLTPRAMKSAAPPPIQDEDSGLGMEFDEGQKNCSVPEPDVTLTPHLKDASHTYSVRRTLFQKSKISQDNFSIKRPRKEQSRDGMLPRKNLTKSLSFGDEPRNNNDVISVVERLVEEDNLIGNGAQTYCLPTIPGKHSDLKSITPDTMADVLAGKYDDSISSYRVIDCRYPYEYDGGHIKDAENMYTREQVLGLLEGRNPAQGNRRDILIFHCEFSSERGPKMCRFLRNKDREANLDNYPLLYYPEVYLLHDGYKAFYETKQEFCEPMTYKPMLHSSHTDDLRHFRSKSKSWCAGQKRKMQRLKF